MEIILRLSYTLFIGALMGSSKEEWTRPVELLEVCPYTSFCEKNSSQLIHSEYSAEFVPCCRPCSCSEMCGLYGNCCHRDFDKYPEKVNNEGVCHWTIDPDVSRFSLYSEVHYRMIDKCSENVQGLENAHGCENNYTNSKSTFHPVYSPSKRRIYVSKQCAHWNNVTDGMDWQMVVNCISVSSFSDNAENLINGKATVTNDCILNFIPPKGLDLTFLKCEPDIIRTCNVTGMVSEQDKLWDLCLEFNATYILINANSVISLRYANIFCWMCNSRRLVNETMDIQFACPSRAIGEESKQLIGTSLTVILDMMEEPKTLNQTIAGQCLANEVFVTSFQNSCRPRRCPIGQIMWNSKCDFYSSQWDGGPFSFLLKLTPLNSMVIPMAFFSNMSVDIRSSKLATWMQRGVLRTWHVLPLIQETENQTAVKYMVAKLTYPYSSVNPSYLQAVLKQALWETWMLHYNGVQFRLKVALNDVIMYTPMYSQVFRNWGIFFTQFYVFIPDYNLRKGFPMIMNEYLSPLNSIPKVSFGTGFFISKLWFCEQIDLMPEEYDFFYATILFKKTKKTIYDANFRIVKTEIAPADSSQNPYSTVKQTWTVRMCIDDFPDNYNKVDISCQIPWSYNLMLFVLFYHLL